MRALPSCDPNTVNDIVCSPAVLRPLLIPDTTPLSYELAIVKLPTRPPAVTATLELCPCALRSPTLHTTDESDPQPVDSLPVHPSRAPNVHPVLPPPDHDTETICPSPDAALLAPIPDIDTVSYDTASLPLPNSPPAVTPTLTLPRVPPPTPHASSVVDVHTLASLLLPPTRP